MSESDIKKIIKILKHRNRSDLADLLINSNSNIMSTSNYGSALFSIESIFEIFSPLEKHDKLKNLSDKDKNIILTAIKEIYPTKQNSTEIIAVEYNVDLNLKVDKLIDSNKLNKLKFDYILEQIEKCEDKIADNDYDGAITNARSLLETVCIYIIENSGKEIKNKGNLINLHKEVSSILKMKPNIYVSVKKTPPRKSEVIMLV